MRGKLVDLEPVRLVVGAARLRGCTCDPPGVEFLTGPMRFGELGFTRVMHDNDCPVMANGEPLPCVLVIPDPEGRS
jgi:hypothetical protein